MKRPENIRKLRFIKKIQLFSIFFLVSLTTWVLINLTQKTSNLIHVKWVFSENPYSESVRISSFANGKSTGFNQIWYYVFPKKLKLKNTLLRQNNKGAYYFLPNQNIPFFQQQWEKINIESFDSDTIYIKSPNHLSKKVPVLSRIELFPKNNNYSKDEIFLKPDSIMIYGTKNELDNIHFIPTEIKYFSEVEDTFLLKLKLDQDFIKSHQIQTDKKIIHLFGTASKKTEIKMKMPIELQNTSNMNIEIFPNKANLSFVVKLADYKKIDRDSLQIVAKYSDTISVKKTYLPLQLENVPNEIEFYRIEPAFINFIIK